MGIWPFPIHSYAILILSFMSECVRSTHEDAIPWEGSGVPWEDSGVPWEDTGVPWEDTSVSWEDTGVSWEETTS